MNRFLICDNAKCCMVLDLREDESALLGSETVLSVCPECEDNWSSVCPFCRQSLDVNWRGGLPHCARCRQKLGAKARLVGSQAKVAIERTDLKNRHPSTIRGKAAEASA